MTKEYIVEAFLVFIISILFCVSLFSVYNLEKYKIDNMEKDITEIKGEIYQMRLDLVTMEKQSVSTK